MSAFVDDRIVSQVSQDDQSVSVRESGTTLATRRTTMRLAAGSGVFALMASAFGHTAVHAQDASPEPSNSKDGLYVVARSRVVRADASIDELNNAISDGLAPMIAAIPGFIEYYVMQNPETRERTSVSIFTDREGADASTVVAGEFLSSEGLGDYYEDLEPVVLEGEIVVSRI